MKEYLFKLEEDEANLIVKAVDLYSKTLIEKMQMQFKEQVAKSEAPSNNEPTNEGS